MSASTAFLKRLFVWPLVVNAPLALLFWWGEDEHFAATFLVGALVCWLANVIFALPLLQKIRRRSRRYFLTWFCLLECLKLCLYGAAFVVILIYWHLSFEPMLLGFILNIGAYGLISLISLGDR